LTGLINVSMKTMYASDSTALAVLSGYLVVLSGVAWVIRHKRFMI
jgi:phosphatidylinositol glycan class W